MPQEEGGVLRRLMCPAVSSPEVNHARGACASTRGSAVEARDNPGSEKTARKPLSRPVLRGPKGNARGHYIDSGCGRNIYEKTRSVESVSEPEVIGSRRREYSR